MSRLAESNIRYTTHIIDVDHQLTSTLLREAHAATTTNNESLFQLRPSASVERRRLWGRTSVSPVASTTAASD
ncbi:hypothetical protein EYF80_068388 [Liparis tanakae]|uniref:Uncharacterized protein n=1 Tax=Liparis tanakae TaxID=230148 RepID=A0A4Z2DY67_9TELE|nr:hypothetical protein EYF80_068388 [Liparis tanakae]